MNLGCGTKRNERRVWFVFFEKNDKSQQSVPVKKFWKLVNNWRRCGQK